MTEDNLQKSENALGKERRKDVRISCRFEIEASAGKNWFIIYSRNISMDGMMFTTESNTEKLKTLGIVMGKKVSLSFYLFDDNLIKVSGQVQHISRRGNPTDKAEISVIGVKFTDVSESAKKQLESFIFAKEKKQ